MKYSNFKKRMVEVSSALLILLFVYTALTKLLHIHSFRLVLGESPMVGTLNYVLAISIPLVELVIVVLLFLPGWRRIGLLFSTFLLTVFTLYIAYMLALVPELPCSCGGVLQSLSWKQHLLFNLVVTGISLAAWLVSGRIERTIAIDPVANQA